MTSISKGGVLPAVVLFDLDGTITDPSVDFVASLRYGLEAASVEVPSDQELLAHLGPPLHDSLAAFGLDHHGVVTATAAYRRRYQERDSQGTVIHPGVAELLAELRDHGCRLGVATSKPWPIAQRVLERFELLSAFDTVAGPDLDERHAAKDLVVARALDQQGHPDPASVRMVGDRSFDVVGARAHRIETVAVTWGFAATGELRDAGPMAIVDDAAGLRAALGVPGVMVTALSTTR